MYSTNFSSDKVNPSFHPGGWSGKGRQSGDRCINTRRNGARTGNGWRDDPMQAAERNGKGNGRKRREEKMLELLANKLRELGDDTFSRELLPSRSGSANALLVHGRSSRNISAPLK